MDRMPSERGAIGAKFNRETIVSLNKTVDVLCEVPMFRNVDPKQLRLFAFMGETLNFRAGERLFERGDEGDAAYVVIKARSTCLSPR